jgi:hypothetical protein
MYTHPHMHPKSILWTLYRSYFKGISANIELQVYMMMLPGQHASERVLIKLSKVKKRARSGVYV